MLRGILCNSCAIKLQFSVGQFPDCLLLLKLLPLSQYSIALLDKNLAAFGIYQVDLVHNDGNMPTHSTSL